MNRTWMRRTVAAALASLVAAPALAQTEPATTIQLTLADAVQRAVEHNPDLTVVKLDTEVESARVGESLAAYTPTFSTMFGRTRNTTPPVSSLEGNTGVAVNDWFSSTGVRQRLPWGSGTWSVAWDTARTTTNSPITSFDPSLLSGVEVAFSQPLLKDRAIDASKQQYVIAKRNRDISELRFRESVVQTVASVKQAYWTLQAAVANIGVQQRSLDLAEELVRQNRIRVRAGQIAPLDLVQAEAEAARRRENLIEARTTAEDAEDHLRRLIADPADASFWSVRLEAVDPPPAIGELPDVNAAVARALDGRSDLARANRELENAATNVDFFSNQRLPDVRLETSYRGNGLGGTELLRAGGFPGTIVGTRGRSFGDALGQAFTPDYPSWSVGVTVSYPLGRGFEEASLARAQIEKRQAAQRIASLRLDTAEAVRQAARRVRSAAERVDAARAGATLAEQRLKDEQRRYDVGLSTTFLVTQAQRDLLEAQVNLLQTRLDYQSSMVSFEAVQQAPLPGAAGSVAVRGADIVPLPAPEPRGLFRPGAGR